MHYIPQLIFLIVLGIANYGIFKSIKRIKFNINLGRPEKRNDQKLKRFKIMTLMALGQKKMFKKPLPAIFHFLIYLGFIIVNLEVLEIVLDGIFGTHRIFAPYISNIYPLFINIFEFFAVAVIIACIVFLSRRNLLNINRFQGEEMKKWPKIDANTILIVEVFLMIAFLVMNTVDLVLQSRGYGHYSNTGIFFISGNLMQVFNSFSSENLVFVERF